MRVGLTLVLALAVLAICPACAWAFPPASIPVPDQPDALAYASGRVLWVTHSARGPILVMEAPVTGGPARVLASVERVSPSSESLAISLAANAGGFLLAARDGREIDTGECGCNYDVSEGELVVRGGYDGSLRKLVSCKPGDRGDDEQTSLLTRAGVSGFAMAGAQCGMSASVETVGADGTRAAVPGVTLERGRSYELSYQEPFVAAASGTTRVRVVDLRDGTRRDLALPDGVSRFDFAVQSDGTLVLDEVPGSGPSGVFTWAPGQPAPTRVPGVAQASFTTAVAGASRILFAPVRPVAGELALGLVELDGGGLRAVGAPRAGAERKPLAFDGTAAAFRSKSCTGASQVTVVDITDTTPPSGLSGCPVVLEPSTVRFSPRSRRGSVSVTCPNGCRDDLELNIQLRPRQIPPRELNRYVDQVSSSTLATARLRLSPGATAGRVTVTLERPAVRLLRRHRRLRVFPSLSSVGVGPEIAQPPPVLVARLR